ncbi:S41 family peptidase [Longispora albida]|uniref:S41 family peptidase n=1 Tax=Longispora albida TaxID=203523 RepID=UPI000377ADF5|nr:S41 family peptidase [Longispora albida]
MDITKITQDTSALVAKHYVFPDLGGQLSGLISTRAADGHYATATGPEELGGLVTADLQSVNGDKHLRLKYHAEALPDLPSAEMMMAENARDAARNLNGVARIERLPGNVALLELGPRLYPIEISGPAITAAMQVVASADALVLDLRGTRGGDPRVVALVCSYLFDGRPVHLNDIYDRAQDSTTQFWTLPYVPGPAFGGTKPIRVLTSPDTFSGGEELAYDLQQLGRAVLVGERTGGGAHPRIGIRLHPHLELTVPTARGINPVSGTNWEGTGVIPEIEVPAAEALDAALKSL